MKYCALCCIAKDEDAFLKEWLSYHAAIGFEHFIIYDNLSATPITDFLRDFMPPKSLTVVRNDKEQSQLLAYSHCLDRFGGRFRWIAFLDLDEFIRLAPAPGEAPESVDIRSFLAEFEPYAGLGLNWRMFSSSGHETTPPGPVIAEYTQCLGDDQHIKSIVQPAKIARCAGPHSFTPRDGAMTVNAEHFPIPPGFPFAVPATARASVHHYYYKSRECFERKIAKGNPCNIIRRMDYFDRHLAFATTEDTGLLPFAGQAAAAIAADKPAPAAPPRHLTQEELLGQSEDSLGNAKAYLKRRDAASLREAMLHLSLVSLYNHMDGAPDTLVDMEMWTLRAEAARLQGNTDLARLFLSQAFMLGASTQAHAELANLLLQQGQAASARHVLSIIRNFQETDA